MSIILRFILLNWKIIFVECSRTYIYIYVIRDFSGISAWVWEFYSTFRLSFWSQFSREGAGGLRGLSLVVQGSFWGVSSEWISLVRILGGLGGSGSLGYFEVKGRVLTAMRLTSRLSLFRKNWALSIRSLSLLVSNSSVSIVPSFFETVTTETSAA